MVLQNQTGIMEDPSGNPKRSNWLFYRTKPVSWKILQAIPRDRIDGFTEPNWYHGRSFRQSQEIELMVLQNQTGIMEDPSGNPKRSNWCFYRTKPVSWQILQAIQRDQIVGFTEPNQYHGRSFRQSQEIELMKDFIPSSLWREKEEETFPLIHTTNIRKTWKCIIKLRMDKYIRYLRKTSVGKSSNFSINKAAFQLHTFSTLHDSHIPTLILNLILPKCKLLKTNSTYETIPRKTLVEPYLHLQKRSSITHPLMIYIIISNMCWNLSFNNYSHWLTKLIPICWNWYWSFRFETRYRQLSMLQTH
jgi:hypothetical protein